MNARTVFLAWQAPSSHLWFPVGRLDIGESPVTYRFRYIRGAERAREEANFPSSGEFPCMEFPRMEKEYRAANLFATFRNRVMARGRPDRAEHLRQLGLDGNADPVEILSVNGGDKVTDTYQVFPKISKADDGSFKCRFFLHGWRDMPLSARFRMNALVEREELRVAIELENPVTGRAAQIQTGDYHTIGRAPRWLATGVAAAAFETGECAARVVRVNPMPAPWRQGVPIEMTGRWYKHEPMTGGDFTPLVGE